MCLILRNREKILNRKIRSLAYTISVNRIKIGSDRNISVKILINTERVRHRSKRYDILILLDLGKKTLLALRRRVKVFIIVYGIHIKIVFIRKCLIHHKIRIFGKKIVVRNRFDIPRNRGQLIKESRINILLEFCKVCLKRSRNRKQIPLGIEIIIHFLAGNHNDVDRRLRLRIYRLDLSVLIDSGFLRRINLTRRNGRRNHARYLFCPLAGTLFLARQKLFRVIRFFLRQRIVFCNRRKPCLFLFRSGNSFLDQRDVFVGRNQSKIDFCFISVLCDFIQSVLNCLHRFGRR